VHLLVDILIVGTNMRAVNNTKQIHVRFLKSDFEIIKQKTCHVYISEPANWRPNERLLNTAVLRSEQQKVFMSIRMRLNHISVKKATSKHTSNKLQALNTELAFNVYL